MSEIEKPKVGEWWKHEVYDTVYIFEDNTGPEWKGFECSIACQKQGSSEIFRAFSLKRFTKKLFDA
jgi:hypothetical protein